MSFTEDRSVFFNTSDFADTATYDGATSVDGIFDDEYVELFQGEGAAVSSTRPVFLYNTDDLTAAVGSSLVVGTSTYAVRDIQLDRGIGKLILELTGVTVTPPTPSGVFSNDFSADFY